MIDYINRDIESKVESKLNKGKAIIIYGPRQVGKTTLINNILEKKKVDYLHLNGDEADVRELLSNTTSSKLRSIIGKHKVIFIDEAQRIKNIGLTVKLIVDQIKDVQVIITGSSALELSSNIKEPLTGRKYEFHLYPFSFSELSKHSNLLEEKRLIEQRLVYGYYPEIINNLGDEIELLKLLADSYLYKDILTLGEIKKPELLNKLLKALALQVGSEVSYNELARLTGNTVPTIEKYIDLLEKSFVIFKLDSFSRNVRNEIRKGKKIYFYDNGIRNAVIGNYNPLHQRSDLGALWENFLISERLKRNSNEKSSAKGFFWRTTQQQEIDYIEEDSSKLKAFEFTWNPLARKKISKTFTKAYPECQISVIHSKNFDEFIC